MMVCVSYELRIDTCTYQCVYLALLTTLYTYAHCNRPWTIRFKHDMHGGMVMEDEGKSDATISIVSVNEVSQHRTQQG